MRDNATTSLIAAIVGLIALTAFGCGGGDESSRPAGGRTADAASPVDGVYRSDVTLKELKRTPGYDAGENHPGNIGDFRMTLRDGRFRVTGSSDGVDQEGTFSVKGAC